MTGEKSQVVNEQQSIQDDGNLSGYFAMMLHIDDDDLDAHEYRILGHYRKVCGMCKSGTCTESIETTAKACKMAVATARNARNSLSDKGCVVIQQVSGSPTKVRVVNRMLENLTRYSRKSDTPIKSGRGGLSNLVADIRIEEINTSLSEIAKAPPTDADKYAQDELTALRPLTERASSLPTVETSKTPPPPKVPPPPRKVQPSDVFFKTIAACMYGNDANYDGDVVALVLNGRPKQNLEGLIPFECKRQSKARAELDYEQLAREVPIFWAWLKRKMPELSMMLDRAKWVGHWKTWRADQPQATSRILADGSISQFNDETLRTWIWRTSDRQLWIVDVTSKEDKMITPDMLPPHLKWMGVGAKETL